MGDIADMMLSGEMCQWCGEILDGQGYPTVCPACQAERNCDEFGNSTGKAKCPQCGKKVKEVGLRQHIEAKHSEN